MAVEQDMSRLDDPLMGTHRRRAYNDAERRFSCLLHQRLDDLLQARRNHLWLLRRYVDQPGRLGIMPTPAGLPCDQLRLHVVDELVRQVIDCMRTEAPGGPVAQSVAEDGSVREVQTFPTRHPHILIDRTDRYVRGNSEPVETTWCLRRCQNQRQETELNRFLDAAGVVFNVLRIFR